MLIACRICGRPLRVKSWRVRQGWGLRCQDCLRRLTPMQRQVLELRVLGLGWKAIGRRLGLHRTTVREYARAALKKARSHVAGVLHREQRRDRPLGMR